MFRSHAFLVTDTCRLMFWTVSGRDPAVTIASMDGSTSLVINTPSDVPFTWPVSVAIDNEREIAYWLDASFIGSFHLKDGKVRRVLRSDSLKHGLSLVFENRNLYWTSENQSLVYKVALSADDYTVSSNVSIAAHASDFLSGFTVIASHYGGQHESFFSFLLTFSL